MNPAGQTLCERAVKMCMDIWKGKFARDLHDRQAHLCNSVQSTCTSDVTSHRSKFCARLLKEKKRGSRWNQNHDPHFVQAYVVEMHMDIEKDHSLMPEFRTRMLRPEECALI